MTKRVEKTKKVERARKSAPPAEARRKRVLDDEALGGASGGKAAQPAKTSFTPNTTRFDPYKSFNFR